MVRKLKTGRIAGFVASFVVSLLAAFALSMAFSAQASAQLPAICDEYPDLPQCQVDPQPPIEEPDPTDDGPGAIDGDGTGTGNGELPFTGYPLTSLILLLLALLIAGLAIRSYVAIRERLRNGPAPS